MKLRWVYFVWKFFLLFLLLPSFVSAQVIVSPSNPDYDRLKAEGQIPDRKGNYAKANRLIENPNLQFAEEKTLTPPFFKACKELIPVDSSFSVVPFLAGTLGPPPLYRNDDASTQLLTIPFSFCFYGSTFTSLYINNNGNISFDGPQVTYRPDSLPTNDFMALAAFWSDVDTRNFNSGVVYYKIAPTYMIVTWDHVGYYNAHADKKNTFQLIITDGSDSTLLSPGKNVGFRYDEMEWSTGDIGGVNGFSISYNHATVGANKSDSIHFVQFGRFGVSGSAYDGPYGGADGVSWLNGRVFEFNACSGTNIEPIVNNFNYCDTIYSCVGDTSLFELSFLSPERNQITSSTITTTATSGLTVMQNTPGEVNTIKAIYIGDFNNVGYHHVTFSASDNASIPATTILDVVIEVEQLNLPITIAGAGIDICPGTTIPLTATAGFEKYKWSTNETGNQIDAPPGSYYVTGKMGKCYLQSDTVHIGSIPVTQPIIIGNSTTKLCPEDSTLLTVSTDFPFYNWSNGDTSKSSYHHPGNSFVTIIDTNGCSVQSPPFVVPQFIIKPLQIAGLQSVCPGDSVELTASPGFLNYSWNTGASGSVVTVPSGVYEVAAIDSNSCVNKSGMQTISNFIVIKPQITGNKGFCLGDSSQLNVTPNYQSYFWNTGDSISQINVQQGTYFVAVVDTNNCTSTSDTIVVSQFPVSPLSIGGSIGFCPNDSALLLASPGFTDYYWNSGQRADSIYVFAGNYSVTALDTNGCFSYSNSVVIGQFSVTVPQIFGNNITCTNDSASLTASAGFSSYLWSTGNTNPQVKLPAGNYFVEVRDSNLCLTKSALFEVQNYPQNIPLVTGGTICCVNDSIPLTANPGFLQYSWPFGATSSIAFLPPGTYSVEVVDSNNCKTSSANFTIQAYPFIVPQLSGNAFYCNGDSALLSVIPSFVQYNWSNGSTQQSDFVQAGVYNVYATDSNSCTFKSNDFYVQQYPIQVPSISGKKYCCVGDSVQLLAPANFSQFQWSTGAIAPSIFVEQGTYSLTAKDSNSCTSYSQPFTVNFSLPDAQISAPQTICASDSVLLYLSYPFSVYNWNNGLQTPSIYAGPGLFSVQVEDSIGCKALDSVYLAKSNLPNAFFTFEPFEAEANEAVLFRDASTVNGGVITNYSWSLLDGTIFSTNNSASYVFNDSGSFVISLAVTTELGCTDTYTTILRVVKSLKIPNIITPNADGENDLFEIKNLNLNEANQLHVFDRWGKAVFSSNNYQNQWDAKNVKDGVYYYSLQIIGGKEIKGSLTVLR
jgi:gliding motility-associated-like protein